MTVLDYVATHGRARGSALALVDLATSRQWSWAEFDRAVNRVANWLIGQLGPKSGERVATVSKNSADMILLQLGCMRAGAIFVPLNWRLADREILDLLADATPALLFVDAGVAVGSGDHVPEFPLVRHLLADLSGLTQAADDHAPAHSARSDWEAPATLLYTSGTSGKPKGVMVSEANAYWGATNFMLGNAVSQDSVFLCDMPLFHTAGLFANARSPILSGGTLLVSQGFDPVTTLARLSDPALGVTHYFCVPQMAQMLWNQPGFDPQALRRLRVLATGGAPNPAAQITRFVDAGIMMSDGFGMTETCSNFAMPVSDPDVIKAKSGSIGLPFVSVQAQIVNEDGSPVEPGAVGELWVCGPSITKGYWNQPELTARAFHDGWFKTGDAARCDEDGFYFLVDRKKDMYISGGENVYPAEVEAAIAEIAEVAECAVIGVADEAWGEVGRAFVIPVAGKQVTADQVIAHCKQRLARFKCPKTVVITDNIPRTASGKVQKHRLKEIA